MYPLRRTDTLLSPPISISPQDLEVTLVFNFVYGRIFTTRLIYCSIFAGVGIGICLVATYVGMYYNTIIAWALYYMVASFRSEVPWARCNNPWNTPYCVSGADGYNLSEMTNSSIPAAAEYYL